jgi:hypothetical protein
MVDNRTHPDITSKSVHPGLERNLPLPLPRDPTRLANLSSGPCNSRRTLSRAREYRRCRSGPPSRPRPMLQTNTARPSTHPPCIAGSYPRPTSPLPHRTHTTESNTARYPKEHCLFVITLCCNRSPSVVTALRRPRRRDRALRSGAPTAAVRHPHRPNYLSLQRPSDSSSRSPQCSHFRQSAGAPGILTGTWPRRAHSSSSRACRVSYHRGPGGNRRTVHVYPLGVSSDIVLGLISFDRFVAYAAVRMGRRRTGTPRRGSSRWAPHIRGRSPEGP